MALCFKRLPTPCPSGSVWCVAYCLMQASCPKRPGRMPKQCLHGLHLTGEAHWVAASRSKKAQNSQWFTGIHAPPQAFPSICCWCQLLVQGTFFTICTHLLLGGFRDLPGDWKKLGSETCWRPKLRIEKDHLKPSCSEIYLQTSISVPAAFILYMSSSIFNLF